MPAHGNGVYCRYKKLLEESHKDNEMLSSTHERELLSMQERLHKKSDEAFVKFKSQAAVSDIAVSICGGDG